MPKVVFLLLPGVHLLDLAGPAQVFSSAAELGHPYTLHYVADRGVRRVESHQGVGLAVGEEWPELGAEDLVVVPGWHGTSPVGAGSARRLAAHHAGGGTVASVCAGADALGRAGLLDGRRCTTHHELQDELARRYPKAKVVRDILFVSDDRVVTSAGIASGTDLALHLVAERHGPAAAARVARSMVVYVRRNGDEPQASVMLAHRAHLSDTVHRVQDLIDARFAEPLALADLAAQAGVSPRTLTRRFAEATGLTPLRYQQLLRAEHAERLITAGRTIESAAHAVGFRDPRMLRRLRTRPHPHPHPQTP
ncbi:AraC family transcriptional regulator [Actinocorallia sp. A-T 12471]|uniref:GlxA family transcriptional regulator n=1 Tax=Actinocorallia sp. A-T 12471 TaxID=3089813 RepID=UPI0029D36EF2|nr:AraC family transcriptional regulator [Actinocorallia sp. A-T 12471]MDX6744951.1 AraC family transcriptional regulator [Actinocorallia sp. A-T 12471]